MASTLKFDFLLSESDLPFPPPRPFQKLNRQDTSLECVMVLNLVRKEFDPSGINFSFSCSTLSTTPRDPTQTEGFFLVTALACSALAVATIASNPTSPSTTFDLGRIYSQYLNPKPLFLSTKSNFMAVHNALNRNLSISLGLLTMVKLTGSLWFIGIKYYSWLLQSFLYLPLLFHLPWLSKVSELYNFLFP